MRRHRTICAADKWRTMAVPLVPPANRNFSRAFQELLKAVDGVHLVGRIVPYDYSDGDDDDDGDGDGDGDEEDSKEEKKEEKVLISLLEGQLLRRHRERHKPVR